MASAKTNISFPSREFLKEAQEHAKNVRRLPLSTLITQLLMEDMGKYGSKGGDSASVRLDQIAKVVEELKGYYGKR